MQDDPDLNADPAVAIHGFEFDTANLAHLARHEIDENLVWDVWADQPVVVFNRRDRAGTHLMVGQSSAGRCWTIVIVLAQDAPNRWRPITGWPSTGKEKRAWQQISTSQ
jgi:hypothetical protein